jgi:hypothetical protein
MVWNQELAKALLGADSKKLKMRRLPPTVPPLGIWRIKLQFPHRWTVLASVRHNVVVCERLSGMGESERTIIALSDAKEAALYFDYVIPVNLLWNEELILRFRRGQASVESFRTTFDTLLCPPHVSENLRFADRLKAVNKSMFSFFITHYLVELKSSAVDAEEHLRSARTAAQIFVNFIDDFGFSSTPVDVPIGLVTEPKDEESDIAITLASLKLVNAESASWDQIIEFRRDSDARDKLRRLRLFAGENYSGKSKAFIEDDLSVKIVDYEEAVKKWGFDTKYAAFTMLLSSKTMAGALAGSLISTLFGAPLPALASAVGGAALEVGRIALELRKQRFSLRELMAKNPVCYISQARSRLTLDGQV